MWAGVVLAMLYAGWVRPHILSLSSVNDVYSSSKLDGLSFFGSVPMYEYCHNTRYASCYIPHFREFPRTFCSKMACISTPSREFRISSSLSVLLLRTMWTVLSMPYCLAHSCWYPVENVAGIHFHAYMLSALLFKRLSLHTHFLKL